MEFEPSSHTPTPAPTTSIPIHASLSHLHTHEIGRQCGVSCVSAKTTVNLLAVTQVGSKTVEGLGIAKQAS